LTGWKGFTHLDNGSSIPFGLVLQHLSKFRPGSIRNGLGQLMFFTIPFTFRSSRQITWFSRMSLVDNL
jgi:hypothetical protein